MDSTTTDTDRVIRRSVLKATGAAAGAAAVGAAPAAASFTEGQCVVAATTADAWIEACPPAGSTSDVPEGTTGTIGDTCFADGTDYAQVEWDNWPVTWVDTADLEYC